MDCKCLKVLIIGIGIASVVAFAEGYFISKMLIDKEPMVHNVGAKSILSDGVQLHAKEFSSRQRLVLNKAIGD